MDAFPLLARCFLASFGDCRPSSRRLSKEASVEGGRTSGYIAVRSNRNAVFSSLRTSTLSRRCNSTCLGATLAHGVCAAPQSAGEPFAAVTIWVTSPRAPQASARGRRPTLFLSLLHSSSHLHYQQTTMADTLSRVPLLSRDDAEQADLSLSALAHAYGALKAGKMPTSDQLVRGIRKILASSLLQPEIGGMAAKKVGGGKLSRKGRDVVVNERRVLEAIARLVLEKNDDDKIQRCVPSRSFLARSHELIGSCRSQLHLGGPQRRHRRRRRRRRQARSPQAARPLGERAEGGRQVAPRTPLAPPHLERAPQPPRRLAQPLPRLVRRCR